MNVTKLRALIERYAFATAEAVTSSRDAYVDEKKRATARTAEAYRDTCAAEINAVLRSPQAEIEVGNDDDLDLWLSLDEAREDAERDLVSAVMAEEVEWGAKDGEEESSWFVRQRSLWTARKRAVLALLEARRALHEFLVQRGDHEEAEHGET